MGDGDTGASQQRHRRRGSRWMNSFINDAFERMKAGDVRYRFVIDMESLKQKAA